MPTPETSNQLVVFPSSLGWMALVGGGKVLKRLTFGHPSKRAAIKALEPHVPEAVRSGTWNQPLVDRLMAYAAGLRDDFQDLSVDPGPLTEFQAKVVGRCRRIPYGSTLTYGQLAVEAGSPRAARAVGNCMAKNRLPLIIPCHRVITSSGALGGYSAEGGVALKTRLLKLEATQHPGRPRR